MPDKDLCFFLECNCNKGQCNDGLLGDGRCTCNSGFKGVNCDQGKLGNKMYHSGFEPIVSFLKIKFKRKEKGLHSKSQNWGFVVLLSYFLSFPVVKSAEDAWFSGQIYGMNTNILQT